MIFNFSRKVVKEFFSFSRSELRGVILLSVFLNIGLAYRIYNSSKNHKANYEIEDIASTKIIEPVSTRNEITIHASKEKNLFIFDPNISDYSDLLTLGFSQKSAKHIINYRNKGGKFIVPEDILKIYEVDTAFFLEVLPYIKIQNTSNYISNKDKLKIELNTSDTTLLKKIPGIGSVLSKRIIKYRNLLGGFYNTKQLKEVFGITDSLFNTVNNYVFADTIHLKLIHINTCKIEDLQIHPYISTYQAKAIISYKKLSGQFTRKQELVDNYLLSDETYSKVAPYLTLD